MKRTFFFSACLFNHFHRLSFLRRRYHDGMRLDDTGLLSCYCGKCIAKKLHVIHTDRRQDLKDCCPHNIGGVKQSSHTSFQNNDIAVLFYIIQPCDSRLCFKGSGMGQSVTLHILRRVSDDFCKTGKIFSSDHLLVNLNSFTIGKKRGGNISSRPVSGFLKDGGKISQHGTLAVGSRYMYKFQFILWIPQPSHQLPDTVKSGYAAIFCDLS